MKENVKFQIASGSTATVELDSARFNIHKLSGTLKCPNDFLKINGIDESNTGQANGTFPQDVGSESNGIKLCGVLAQTYTYNHVTGSPLKFEFNANDNANLKGFVARICLSA